MKTMIWMIFLLLVKKRITKKKLENNKPKRVKLSVKKKVRKMSLKVMKKERQKKTSL